MFNWLGKKNSEKPNEGPAQGGQKGRGPHQPNPNVRGPGQFQGRPPDGQRKPGNTPHHPHQYRHVSGVSVFFDPVMVRCVKKDGPEEMVRWDDLAGVFIMASVEGKYAADLFWVLAGQNRGGCVFPNTAAGAAEIIRYMQDNLRGFNNRAIIDAMECKESGKFMIWKKD